ncbi:PocR ligand-binding domain-containing protein [Methanosarcina sp. 2.H.A.1B.4]|uniref:PocR ligand-binding domain-containing protein n=1 Tax=Methanosarcina sp. 2.H.A.1B.4 TaxID=1483600 RepID=UPI0006223AC7|nr:PocR ligand-binding domain-containing protein [Methanosarcina sp. 2.H.A.1B.4]KKG10984.1 histidine kinase [Methanosarcina sp. 2.H.A.1B.4]
MGENLRKSGIDIIGNVPRGTHPCQFQQTKEDLVNILIPYFKTGLENNEFCFWVTSQPSGVEEAKKALRMAVPDIDAYLEKGQIEITSCGQGHANEDVFDSETVVHDWVIKLNRALANGFEGLRAAVNTSWLKEGTRDNFANYENKVNSVIGKYQTITLYPYFLEKASTADIIDAAPSHQFILIKKDGKWERIENSRWKNITGGKRTGETQQKNWRDLESRITSESEIKWVCEKAEEEVLSRAEQFIRPELESIFSSDREIVNLELADIIDSLEIQSLMDDFYRFAHISMALVDLKGNVLVGVGWQEICTRFHRIHPETSRHCVESDTKLSAGVLPGEFKLYRCRNNMWDIATPIMVEGQHIGNMFSGQFFFENEPLNYELFRAQARKYGFNEEEYIAALEKVPRLKWETVNAGMNFLTRLANMSSQLSYSNIKLARSLVERDALVNSLRESKEKYRSVVETANEGIWIIDAEDRTIYVNQKMAEMLGYAQHEMIGREIWDFASEEGKAIVRLNQERRNQGINESYELKLIYKGGSSLWVLVNAKSLFDKDGRFMGSISMLTDITKRKEAEEALANIEIVRKKEIHHRIKNNLQVISSLLDLQAEKFNNREDIKDSEVLEAVRESQDRVISMALIHEELYKGGGFDTLNFSSYIEGLAENLFQTYRLGNDDLRLNMDLEENIFFDMDIAVPLGIIVNELVSNSLKHAFSEKEGKIRIKFCREEKSDKADESLFSLIISDNGKGIPENIELENIGTLGLKLVSILVDQLDGNLELKRDLGTEFRISFKVVESS